MTALPAAPAGLQPTARVRGQRATRLGLLALVCLLHAALLNSWREDLVLAVAPIVTTIQIRNLVVARPDSNAVAPPPASGVAASPSPVRAMPPAKPPGAARSPHQTADEGGAAMPSSPEVPRSIPSTEAPLDIDRLRSGARDNERKRVTSPLEQLRERERAAHHAPRSVEASLAEAATRTARKDCQTGYAGYGLFAALPLLYGAVTDDGCKWK